VDVGRFAVLDGMLEHMGLKLALVVVWMLCFWISYVFLNV